MIPELVELPLAAIQYMREELACAHPLANAINSLPLESGHARIFATENMSIEQLLRFRENPFSADEDLRACWQSFKDYITNYLRRDSRRVLIMDHVQSLLEIGLSGRLLAVTGYAVAIAPSRVAECSWRHCQ